MGQVFERIRQLSENKALVPRMRFMLQDLLDLRANNWVARRKEAEPTTIAQVHQQAEKEDKAKDAASRAAMRRSDTQTPPVARIPSSSGLSSLDAPPPSPSPPLRSASRSPHPEEPARGGEDGWEPVKGGRGKGGKQQDDGWSTVPAGARGAKGAAPARGGPGGQRGHPADDRRGGKAAAAAAPAGNAWRGDQGGRGGRGGHGGAGGGRGGREGGRGDGRPPSRGAPESAAAGNKFAAAAKASSEMPATGLAPVAGKPPQGELAAPTLVSPVPTAAKAAVALAEVDFEAKFEQLLEEYLSSHDAEDAATCLNELGAAPLYPQFVQKVRHLKTILYSLSLFYALLLRFFGSAAVDGIPLSRRASPRCWRSARRTATWWRRCSLFWRARASSARSSSRRASR